MLEHCLQIGYDHFHTICIPPFTIIPTVRRYITCEIDKAELTVPRTMKSLTDSPIDEITKQRVD
jgi:hypothetical protein